MQLVGRAGAAQPQAQPAQRSEAQRGWLMADRALLLAVGNAACALAGWLPTAHCPPATALQTLMFKRAARADFTTAGFEGSTHYALEGKWLAAQMIDLFPWLRFSECGTPWLEPWQHQQDG